MIFTSLAVVLHTMNIEGQIHQKNPGMGQTPPPPSWQCQDFGSSGYSNPSLTVDAFRNEEQMYSVLLYVPTGPFRPMSFFSFGEQSESITALWPQQGLLLHKNWFVAEKWRSAKPCKFGRQAINICMRTSWLLAGRGYF